MLVNLSKPLTSISASKKLTNNFAAAFGLSVAVATKVLNKVESLVKEKLVSTPNLEDVLSFLKEADDAHIAKYAATAGAKANKAALIALYKAKTLDGVLSNIKKIKSPKVSAPKDHYLLEFEYAIGVSPSELKEALKDLNKRFNTSVEIVKYNKPGSGAPSASITVKGPKADVQKVAEGWYEETNDPEPSNLTSKMKVDPKITSSGIIKPVAAPGGKMKFGAFEERCSYATPKENAKTISRLFGLAVSTADQFSDGNSFAGCYVEIKSGSKLRTFAICPKEACIPTNVKFSGMLANIVFEVKNKKELFGSKPAVIGQAYTAKGVDALFDKIKELI